MKPIRTDCQRAGATHHMALIADERDGQHHGNYRNADAQLRVSRRRSDQQALDRSKANEAGGKRDQDNLDEGGKGFRLPVSESVLVIGRLGRDTHGEQHDQARDQVEAAIGKGAEHRHRGGVQCGVGLQSDEHHGHGAARYRSPRRLLSAFLDSDRSLAHG